MLHVDLWTGREDNREESESIRQGLYYQHNQEKVPIFFEHINLYLRDEAGNVQGGLLAEHYWDCLLIATLWIAPPYRGQGYGTVMMRQIEDIARQRQISLIHLDTHEFQAPRFYEKLGYSTFGILEGSPRGYKRYFMVKRLAGEGCAPTCVPEAWM